MSDTLGDTSWPRNSVRRARYSVFELLEALNVAFDDLGLRFEIVADLLGVVVGCGTGLRIVVEGALLHFGLVFVGFVVLRGEVGITILGSSARGRRRLPESSDPSRYHPPASSEQGRRRLPESSDPSRYHPPASSEQVGVAFLSLLIQVSITFLSALRQIVIAFLSTLGQIGIAFLSLLVQVAISLGTSVSRILIGFRTGALE